MHNVSEVLKNKKEINENFKFLHFCDIFFQLFFYFLLFNFKLQYFFDFNNKIKHNYRKKINFSIF